MWSGHGDGPRVDVQQPVFPALEFKAADGADDGSMSVFRLAVIGYVLVLILADDSDRGFWRQ